MKPRGVITLKDSDIPRFWSKVDSTGGPAACWPYVKGQHFRVYVRGRGTVMYQPRRVARMIDQGDVAPDTIVVTRVECDARCCNPAHLQIKPYTKSEPAETFGRPMSEAERKDYGYAICDHYPEGVPIYAAAPLANKHTAAKYPIPEDDPVPWQIWESIRRS